jgi:hypothetical protein
LKKETFGTGVPMKLKQISVFLENRPGILADLTTLLGDHGINIRALSIAETRDFGVIRMIVPDPALTADLLYEKGYSIQVVEVLAVEVTDEPGGLGKALSELASEHLNVDYLYTFMNKVADDAVIVLRADNLDYACTVLSRKGFKLLSQEDFRRL